MTYYALIDHHNLGTAIYDLGIYDNLVWQTAHGFFLDCSLIKGGNHVSAHFDPIIALIALVYRLYMHAETLLVLQTLWLASGAIPLYLLAKRRLSNEWFAAILGLIYLLYPALHGVNMFDFHSLAFVVPSAMWAVYLLDTGGFKRYWLVIALMLITREDISLLNCFVGAYAIMIGRTRTRTVASGAGVSADKAYSYVYYYAEMIPHKAEGTRGLAISALTNPLYALLVSFKEEKLLFFLHLLLPLLCLPFAAGKKLILSVYGLLFIGLATRSHVFSLHFQYSALLFPMLFAAVPDGLRRVTDGPRIRALGIERAPLAWTLLFGMLTASLVTTVKYGVIRLVQDRLDPPRPGAHARDARAPRLGRGDRGHHRARRRRVDDQRGRPPPLEPAQGLPLADHQRRRLPRPHRRELQEGRRAPAQAHPRQETVSPGQGGARDRPLRPHR